jgi:hypothetical protein
MLNEDKGFAFILALLCLWILTSFVMTSLQKLFTGGSVTACSFLYLGEPFIVCHNAPADNRRRTFLLHFPYLRKTGRYFYGQTVS